MQTIIRPYDHADFSANPGKYQLFKTARIASHVFTENGHADMPAGECVGVQYLLTAYNALRRRNEPVYAVKCGDTIRGSFYGSTLADFVL